MTDVVESQPETPPDPNAVNVTINGVAHVARKGQLVIQAAEDAGEFIPRFCYHDRMTPVGKCRMCLVECDSGRGPAVTVSCMVPVAPDMKIETQSPMAKRMQEGVLELLLANHPLDCPVCDKGGECPLQDQSFSHGAGESRFVEEKRHHEKPIPISELVYLDRERCILCDRCTRFADEVAGDPLIHFISRGNNTQVMTFPDEPFASYFSGNTVQICPVGALTAKPYRFKARPWDLEEQRSTCTTCAVGCQTTIQSSRDELVRSQGHDSGAVNWSWLCDRGRFAFEATKSPLRLANPAVRDGDELIETTWSAAYAKAAELIRTALETDGPSGVVVLGGARGTNEDAYAWARLAHDVIKAPSVYAQMWDSLPQSVLELPRATIDEAANAATIITLCGDLKEELPVLYLRLRDAATKKRSKIIEFTHRGGGLSPYAWKSVTHRAGEQVAAVAETLARDDVAAQLAKGPVVIVVGKANYAEQATFTMEALAALLDAVPSAKVLPAFRRGNVVGALQLGMNPSAGGKYTPDFMKDAAEGKVACLILVGADPLSDFPDQELGRRAIAGARTIIAVDTFINATTQYADVVFAAAAYGEKSGTTTNIEGRVTAVAQKVNVTGTSRPDWMIATELADALGTDLGFTTVDSVTEAIAANVPAYADATPAAVRSAVDGILCTPEVNTGFKAPHLEVSPTGAGFDYRLAVGRKLYDQAVGTQVTQSMAGLANGAHLHMNPLDLDRFGGPGRELKVSTPTTTVIIPAVADAGVPRGGVWIEYNQSNVNAGELIDVNAAVIDVRVESV